MTRPAARSKMARVLVSLTLLVPTAPVGPVEAVSPCGDVHVVWARGTNLSVDGLDWNQFVNLDLTPRVGPENSVSEGRQELVAYLADRHAQCGNETYILGSLRKVGHRKR